MLHARTLPGRPVVCPACEKSTYRVYRREPSGEGQILNRCRCESCDETFGYEEDKFGRILSTAQG